SMKQMRIAIDKGPLTSGHKVRGVGAYTREIIEALKKITKGKKDIKIKPLDFSTQNSKLPGLAKRSQVPSGIWRSGVGKAQNFDLVHYTYFHPFFLTLPLKACLPVGRPAKTVVTIHDLIQLIYPNQYPPGLQGKVRFQMQKYLIKKVDGIITVSETSKKDIVRFLGVPAGKIKVIYEAQREIFRKLEVRGQRLVNIKKKYGLPERFVLYVGDVNYNKNIMGLIEACKIAKIPLVICGKQAKDIEELGLGLDVLRGPMDWFRFLFNIPHPELAHFKDTLDEFQSNRNLIRPGFVPDKDLVAIYNLASVYCQPSFYEGFGLPVLEAMACGTPVVCAKTQALVEIAGDAALFADPQKPKDMAEKISELIRSAERENKLIKMGLQRVKIFSWRKAAEETVEVYKSVGGVQ
ncbi:MAG: glycosyltransferase family 4 protein, partial [Patescibacteria group bacterium]